MRAKLKKIVALCLILVMFTPSIAYAGNQAGSNPTGAGGNLTPTGSVTINAHGVLLKLQLVDNKTSDSDKAKIKEKAKNPESGAPAYDEVGVTVVDQYLYNYPAFMTGTDSSLPNSSALILRSYSYNNEEGKSKTHLLAGSGDQIVGGIKKVYYANANGAAASSYSLQLLSGTLSAEQKEQFADDKLEWSVVQEFLAGRANETKLVTASNKFVELFNKTGSLATNLNGLFDKSGTEAAALKNDLVYLDLLILIHYMTGCSQEGKQVIENYLKTRNKDGSEKFSVIFMAAVVSHSGLGSQWAWFTLPNYYAYATGYAVDSYCHIIGKLPKKKALEQPNLASTALNAGNRLDWIKDYYAKFKSVSNNKSKSQSPYYRMWGANSVSIWWAKACDSNAFMDWQTATMLMPTDIWGNQTGACGYTYFSNTGYKKFDNPGIEGQLSVTIDGEPAVQLESEDDPTSVTVILDLTSDDKKIEDTQDAFSYAKDNSLPVKVTISLKGVTKSGAENPSFFDTILTPEDFTLSGGNKIVIEDCSWEEFEPYMKGEKVIKINDEDIKVAELTEYEYYAKVEVYVTDTIKGTFEPKGDKIGEDADEDWAYTIWMADLNQPPTVDEDDPPTGGEPLREEVSYYSMPETPYAEIKQGTPGNETFEAMAGVPTTEDLYVAFGGSEFILNLEATHETDTNNANRRYTYTYTCSNCYDGDSLCEYSCPGNHTVTVSCNEIIEEAVEEVRDADGNIITPAKAEVRCKGGTSAPVSCANGPVKAEATCKCGKSTNSQTFTPSWGEGHSVCTASDGTICYTGMGCQATHCTGEGSANKKHSYTKTFTGVVNQPIDTFSYMDITGLELWRLNELRFEGNTNLLSNPNVSFDPGTGYEAFYSQKDYASGNGRLIFSWSLLDGNKYGDTTGTTHTNSKFMLPTEADDEATKWMNEQVAGKTVQATVVSDYLVLGTTLGYQIPLFHTYKSDTVALTSEQFAVGSTSKTINGEKITFSNIPDFDAMWTNNGNSAGKWKADSIVRSGYNGDCTNPASKWYNAAKPRTISNPASSLSGLPNVEKTAINTYFMSNNSSNSRMYRTGLNIIDSTDRYGNWSAEDSVEPVSNGLWDTGHAYCHSEKVISYESTEGKDWSNKGSAYEVEAGYTGGQSEINDIVVHNPVSAQYAIVVSNPAEYDLRTDASLEKKPEIISENIGCPNDASCMYSKLTCTITPTAHTEACYKEVEAGVNHVGGFNTHVHDASCSAGSTKHAHSDACTSPVYHTHTGSSTSGTGCYAGGAYHSGGTCGASLSWAGSGYTTTSTCSNCGQFTVSLGYYFCTNGHTGSAPGSSGSCNCGNVSWSGFNPSLSHCSSSTGGYYSPNCGKTTSTIESIVYICPWSGQPESGWLETITLPYRITADWNGTGVKTAIRFTGASSPLLICPGEYMAIQHSGSTEYHLTYYTSSGGTCMQCGKSYTTAERKTKAVHSKEFPSGGGCTGLFNSHTCTSACTKSYRKCLVCSDPHHQSPGEPWDPNDPKNHYSFGDLRCYTPCRNDSKHDHGDVKLPDGTIAKAGDTFINIDRQFRIYFPSVGDFAQMPSLYGLTVPSNYLGKGYIDGMNTAPYTRDKFVTFPVDVIWYSPSGTARSFRAFNRIPLTELQPDVGTTGYYTFYCTLSNGEAINAEVSFNAIANNAQEVEYYSDNTEAVNRDRRNYAAKHTAEKKQGIDVVGCIGSLTLHDTGDYRFSTLFKQSLSTETNGWLLEGILPKVDINLPNYLLTDKYNVLHETISARTLWQDTYAKSGFAGVLGKNKEPKLLPLTIADCEVDAFQNQQLMPGYKLYMDVETVGDYYGENRDEAGRLMDTGTYYKMQITPRYWFLNTDTGAWTPVDVFYSRNGNYSLLVPFASNQSERANLYYYVDWTEESGRRNYSPVEKLTTEKVIKAFSDKGGGAIEALLDPIRSPSGKSPIGTADSLFLIDRNRTFIGNTFTDGVNRNPNDEFWDEAYMKHAQRWHFTIGLPSSAVFVEAGRSCTTENIKNIRNQKGVIVCSVDIKVRGDIWTLEYDGSGINQSDGGGIRVYKNGGVYTPPIDPVTGKRLTDPIIAVYSNKYTAANDLSVEGSH